MFVSVCPDAVGRFGSYKYDAYRSTNVHVPKRTQLHRIAQSLEGFMDFCLSIRTQKPSTEHTRRMHTYNISPALATATATKKYRQAAPHDDPARVHSHWHALASIPALRVL